MANYNGRGGGLLQNDKILWDKNRTLRIISNRNWYNVDELNCVLSRIRNYVLTEYEDRAKALNELNKISHPLAFYNVDPNHRFSEHIELICEDFGLWKREFIKLRCSLSNKRVNELSLTSLQISNINQINEQFANNATYTSYNNVYEMLDQLEAGKDVFNRTSFENQFKLQWY